MKHNRFTESQVVNILKQQEAGSKLIDLCREHGINDATFYIWKAKYGGMDNSQLRRLHELEEEKAQLRRMFADHSLVHVALEDAIEKNPYAYA